MLVFACDPGGSTGWSVYFRGESTTYFAGSQFEEEDHHLTLWQCLLEMKARSLEDGSTDMIIVSESFEFRNDVFSGEDKKRVGLVLVSKEYIGVMKLFAQMYNLKYVEQTPASAKRFVSDKRIEQLGLLKSPKYPNRHYHDSLRHLLHFLVVRLRIRAGITDKWRKN